MHSLSSKKTRKLNSFYLDNTKNINLGTTSSHLSSTTTVNTSIYKVDKLSNSSSATSQYSSKLVTDAYKENNNNMYHLQAREKRRQKIYIWKIKDRRK
uniref:Uncharacterized protein n=1 Tax=Lactuca sativa TaxID=4236 RepID=A0A9R1WZ72_LACSA|nr:hypothetical protein LSAT_V11C800451080 [Lactuca sativa]